MSTSSSRVYGADDLREGLFGTPSDVCSSLPTPGKGGQEADTAVTPACPSTAAQDPPIEPNSVLDQYDMVEETEGLKSPNAMQFLVLYVLAQKGRWTVIYAAPNAGKTLITFAMLVRTIKSSPAVAQLIFYVNADDNTDGLVDKGGIAAEHGFKMLVPGFKEFNITALQTYIKRVCKAGLAHRTIIIIDTLKKAVDLMKKSELRALGECLRGFVMMGGTLIALAHTNKNVGSDGKPIPEGTADIINDADCVYLAHEIHRDAVTKTVKFECRKTRGGDPSEIFFQYSTEPNLTYQELLSTVEVVDGSALESFKPIVPPTAEELIVSAIRQSISAGINTKMRLRDAAADSCGASKREVIKVIEEYTGKDPSIHKWHFTRGERGRQQFMILKSDSADFQNSSLAEDSTCPAVLNETTNPIQGD
jgi:hypothetical protein